MQKISYAFMALLFSGSAFGSNVNLGCSDAASAASQVREHIADVEAGPIWNQLDAEGKCPAVCASNNGEWTGEWATVVWNEQSVCQCLFPDYRELQPNNRESSL